MDRITEIKKRLDAGLTPESIDIRDDSALHAGHAGAASGAGHYAVTIVSAQFHGKPPLERHRMVYATVKDMMPEHIHALSIQALTPDEQAARH